MTTPQQPPVTATAILEALKATKDEVAAAKAEIVALRSDMDADREASQQRDARLTEYGRGNRLRIWLVTAGLVLDVIATALAGYSYLQYRHAQEAAQRNAAAAQHNAATVAQLHANNVAACQAGNARLAKQRAALDNILNQVPPQTPAQRAIVSRDLAQIQAGWASRACQEIYKIDK